MLNNFQFQRYITSIAHNNGLKVEWTDEKQPRTNGTTIFIPKGKATDTDKEWKERLYYAVHEAGGHQRFSDMKMWQEKGIDATTSLLGLLWNVLEDHRVDYLNACEFEGDRTLANEIQGNLAQGIIDNARKNKGTLAANPEAMQKIDDAFPALDMLAQAHSDVFPAFDGIKGKFAEFLGTKGKERNAKMEKGDYLDCLRDIRDISNPEKGTAATYDLAKRIFKEVYDLDPEAEEERCKKEKQKGEGKDKQEGEGEDGEDGEGEGEGKPGDKEKEGEGKAKPGEGKEGEDEKKEKRIKVNYKDLVSHVNEDDRGKVSQTSMEYEGHDYNSKTYTPVPFSDYCTFNFPRGTQEGPKGNDRHESKNVLSESFRGADFIVEPCMTARENFSNDVRQRLQVRSRSRWEYAKKQGKLHRPSLHKVLIKDAPGYNERVFKNKVVSDTLDIAVTVLIDTSGSMGRHKYTPAAVAACMLNESLGNVLHIPLEIVGFTEWGSTPVNFVYREHGTKLLGREQLVDYLKRGGGGMSNNADGDSIVWVYNRLLQQKNKRKLLIVLSDGSPAYSGTRGDIHWYTKEVVSRIEREKRVEVYGIGIMDASVKYYYKDHQVLDDVNKLEETLLTLIDRKLT